MMRKSAENHGMSSDQEFLNGVRRKINTLQLAVQEEENLTAIRRRSIFSQCRFVLVLVMVSVLFWLVGPALVGKQGTLYIWALFMLSLGSVYEYFREVRSEYRWKS